MKKIILGLMALSVMTMFTACGSTDTAAQGDTYNVSVNNAGDGDVVVNTGSGAVTIGKDDSCLITVDENTTRPCTDAEYDDAYGIAAGV